MRALKSFGKKYVFLRVMLIRITGQTYVLLCLGLQNYCRNAGKSFENNVSLKLSRTKLFHEIPKQTS